MGNFLDKTGLTTVWTKVKSYVDGKFSTAAAYKVNGKAISSNPTLAKGDVGLGNVDNVKQVPYSSRGVANGVATLDSAGKVPSSQLPGYVDDVLEYLGQVSAPTIVAQGTTADNTAGIVYAFNHLDQAFKPGFVVKGKDGKYYGAGAEAYGTKNSSNTCTPDAGKIYVQTDNNRTYRWSGSGMVEISASLALGTTSSTAYAGDKGVALEGRVNTNASNITSLQKSLDNKVDKPISFNEVNTTKYIKIASYSVSEKIWARSHFIIHYATDYTDVHIYFYSAGGNTKLQYSGEDLSDCVKGIVKDGVFYLYMILKPHSPVTIERVLQYGIGPTIYNTIEDALPEGGEVIEASYIGKIASDTKVTQNAVGTANAAYNLLLAQSSGNTAEETGAVNKANGLTFNPSTGVLTAKTVAGNLSGWATSCGTATKASQDGAGNNIVNTYMKKTDAVALPTKTLADLDTMTTDLANQYANGSLPSCYRVKDADGNVVGYVNYFSDNAKHGITQVLITRQDFGDLASGHDYGVVNARYRTWGIASSPSGVTIPTVQGKWNDWTPLVDPIVLNMIKSNTSTINSHTSSINTLNSKVVAMTADEIAAICK